VFHRAEYDDLVAVRRAECRQPAAVDVGQRDLELAAKDRLVHEQEVTDEQGVFHARRGDAEGFDQKRPQHNPDQQGRSDRLQPGDRLIPRALARRLGWVGGGWWRLWRPGSAHGVSIQSAMKMLV